MRRLGIDFGERRIGLAATDSEGRIPFPLETLERRSDRHALAALARLADEREIEEFVIGIPLRLDGTRGDAAERVEGFAGRLEARCGLPVIRIDEALTSHAARERLTSMGVDLRKHPKKIDAMAAQILLEEAILQTEETP